MYLASKSLKFITQNSRRVVSSTYLCSPSVLSLTSSLKSLQIRSFSTQEDDLIPMDASKNHKTDRKYDNKKFDNKKFQDKKPHDRKFHDKKFDKGGNFVPFRGDQTRERNGGKVGLEGDGDVLPPKINELQRKLNYLADLKSKVGEQSEDYICAKTCVDKCAYDSTQTPSIIQAPNALDAPFRKGKKSKFAFTVAYRGTGYRGLQINKDTNTIELELVRAFHAAGFIDAFQLDDMHKVKWTRAARTDKGVHAAANTIALNIRVLPDQMYPEVAALRQRVLPLLQQRQDALVAALQSHLTKLNIAVPDAFLRAEVGVLPYGEVRVPAELSALLADNGVDVAALQTPAELNVNEREDQLLRLNFCESKRPRVPVDYAALRGLDADAVAAQLQSLETQRKAALEEHLATMESRTTLASNAVNKEDEENEFFSVEDQALMYNSDFASDSICSAVNAFLPAQIRLLRATRALNSFDSKLNATSRTYEYIMPSFAFIPLNQYPAGLYDLMIERVPPLSTLGAEEEQRVLALMERDSEGKVVRDEDEAGEEKGRKRGQADDDLESEEKDDAEVEKAAASRAAALAAAAGDMDAIASVRGLAPLPAEFRNYRMSAEDRARVDAILSVFHGTHNHHNFTKGRQPNNPSCSRFINSFKTTGFFYKDGVEFVHVVVHGQSFMLHQIRKMIGYTVGVARGTLDADAAKNFFSKQRYRVPIAPALGLLLDHVHFRTYDLKVAETTDKPVVATPLKGRESMSFEYEKCLPAVMRFKEQEIYPEICGRELATLSCWEWLHWTNDDKFWGQPQDDMRYALTMTKRAKVEVGDLDNKGLEYVTIVGQENTTASLPSFTKDESEAKQNEKQE